MAEEAALRRKRKLALFKRLKNLLWRSAMSKNESESSEEPAQKKIKLDLSEEPQNNDEEKNESEPTPSKYSIRKAI